MSGHSKWATIHKKKGELDEKRGKVFQKIAKELYVAAKSGFPDIDANPSLRMVVEKARAANMPKDNIQKAIDKAKGSNNDESYESITYEGYGPGGVALMVDCLTDNKNRTASQVRAAFTKKGGNLGTSGSVSYMFERQGVIVIEKQGDEDDIMMNALESGATDFIANDDNYEIITKPNDFIKVKQGLENIGIKDFLSSEVTFVATNKIELDQDQAEKVLELVDILEDLDDVQEVYNNLK